MAEITPEQMAEFTTNFWNEKRKPEAYDVKGYGYYQKDDTYHLAEGPFGWVGRHWLKNAKNEVIFDEELFETRSAAMMSARGSLKDHIERSKAALEAARSRLEDDERKLQEFNKRYGKSKKA